MIKRVPMFQEPKKYHINRRDFLMGIIGLTAGASAEKHIYDYWDKLHKEDILDKIYNTLPKHVHIAETSLEVIDFSEATVDILENKEGCGIILGDKYLTSAHIVHIPFTRNRDTLILDDKKIKIPKKAKIKRKTKLYGYELEELSQNNEKDIAIYRLHSDLKNKLNLSGFPCKPQIKIKLGERVYLIGNPQLEGWNIREATISDLDGYDNVKIDFNQEKNSFFGVDRVIIPGDSGSPVVNENYELLGISTLRYYSSLGYVKRIEEVLKEKCMKGIKTVDND